MKPPQVTCHSECSVYQLLLIALSFQSFFLQTKAIDITRVSDAVPFTEDRDARDARVSGNGKYFAYQSESDYKNTGLAPFADGVWNLWRTSNVFSGGGVENDVNELISNENKPSDKDAKMVSISHDGSRACYSSNIPGEESIMLAEFANDGIRTIKYITNFIATGGRDALYCDISADGGTIVFESDGDLIQGIPTVRSKDQIYMTQDDGTTFTMITPSELSTVSKSQGASVSKDGSFVSFRSTMQSDLEPIPSSTKPEAWLYRSSDKKLTRVTNLKEQECDTALIYSKMVERWTEASLGAEGITSGSTLSCPYAATQGWLPSTGTIGIGAVNQPKISDNGRFMSFTTNFNAATVQGTMERPQLVAGTNLFLYDQVLGFTWQITKEGEIGAATDAAIEAFCCPGASSNKKRGFCSTKDEMRGSCCWQKPCWFPALNSYISGNGESIVFVTDMDHSRNDGDTDAIWKDLEIVHYHIPTSTFTPVTKTSDSNLDDFAPSLSYDGDIIAFTSDYDYVKGKEILSTNQIFAAKIGMGCSKDADAINYVQSPDIEICCEFAEDSIDMDDNGALFGLRFNGDLSEALDRVPFFDDGTSPNVFCTQYMEDVKKDVACSLTIPKKAVKVTYPNASTDPCGDWMKNGIRVEFEIMPWGHRTSTILKSELVDQQNDPSSRLWNGYLTKTMMKVTEAPTVNPTKSPSLAPTKKDVMDGLDTENNLVKKEDKGGGLSGGSIAGITIGTLVGVAALVYGVRMFNRRRIPKQIVQSEHFFDDV